MNAVVVEAIESNAARMISDGMPYPDLMLLKRGIDAEERWCERWVTLAHEYEDHAAAALAVGSTLTAGEHLWRAALCCHFGQGTLMSTTAADKLAADRYKQSLFVRAAPLLEPALERVAIPFEDQLLPGYLRLAPGPRPAPCMVIFGGLDTTKEDALELTNYFIARGISTLTFDGPGQGEVFYRMKVRLDYDAAASAVISYACTRPEIDAQRIGVLGRSTGGHWACKTAATDERVKVAIAWGLIYHLREFDRLSAALQQRFMRAANMATADEAHSFFKGFDLDGYAERITCPLMVVQGGKDPIAPRDSVERLAAKVQGPLEVIVHPDSGHCAHDRAHLSKPAMADFARRILNRN